MEQLCMDLAVDPSDVLLLALAWRLDAATMCCFTRAQFRRLGPEGVKALPDLKRKLPEFMTQAVEVGGLGLGQDQGQGPGLSMTMAEARARSRARLGSGWIVLVWLRPAPVSE